MKAAASSFRRIPTGFRTLARGCARGDTPGNISKSHSLWDCRSRRAFTLIEIMVCVAIMGLIMALGLPSILASLKKDGMRKALSDLNECCETARGEAIMQNRTVSLVFHPPDKSFGVDGGGVGSSANKVSSSVLPNGVDFAMLDINLMDFGGSDICRVRFFPDGTSDEMTLVLHAKDQWRKMTLEFSTAIPSVSEVNQ